jgi:membrane associated rhomboid family serine protease
VNTTPAPVAVKNPAKRIIPPQPLAAAVVIVSFTALLYLVELVNVLILHNGLNNDGIVSREVMGLPGIIWAPFIHAGWAHLIGNTIPVLVFGFLAMAPGIGPWVASTILIWLVSGIGVWLTTPAGTTTIGASGIAFGWLAFLLIRGLFNRSFAQIVIALVLLFYWGGVLWGLLPGSEAGVSWQAHVFGALGGVLAALLVTKANRQRPAKPVEQPTVPGNLAA